MTWHAQDVPGVTFLGYADGMIWYNDNVTHSTFTVPLGAGPQAVADRLAAVWTRFGVVRPDAYVAERVDERWRHRRGLVVATVVAVSLSVGWILGLLVGWLIA